MKFSVLFIILAIFSSEILCSTLRGGKTSRLVLPDLGGNYCVGKYNAQSLIDSTRNDPFAPNPNQNREVVIQVYYPTEEGKRNQCIGGDYSSPGYAAWVEQYFGGTVPSSFLSKIKTHSVVDAKPASACKKSKLYLFSHGFGCSIMVYQAMIEDFASRGHIVVAISHPYDSGFTQFPDGRTANQNPVLAALPVDTSPQLNQCVDIRVADSRFILNSIAAGKVNIPGYNKDDTYGLRKLTEKVGMWGHSMGGELSMNVMLQDQRVFAGVNLDGWFFNQANATAQTDKSRSDVSSTPKPRVVRPYFLMRSDKDHLPPAFEWVGGGPRNEIDAMKAQTGPKLAVAYPNAQHFVYSDASPWHQLIKDETTKNAIQTNIIGNVVGKRAHEITTNYVNWFFTRCLDLKCRDISGGLGPIPELKYENIN